jgi:hypothetical protein
VAGVLLLEAVAGVGLLPGQALVQHAGQRVHVGAHVGLFGAEALGRHVVPGADDAAGPGQTALTGGARDPEIDQIRVVVPIEQNVGRLHIAVHQPNLVGRVQRPGDLLDDPHRPAGLERAVDQDGVQVATLDQPISRISTNNRPSISP